MSDALDIDQYTAQVVPNTRTTISNQYFDLNQPFAFPRHGNQCTAFTSGRDFMKAVADAIRSAKSFIMITGWQLDYDVELDNRGVPGHPGRLSELLADAIQRGVHIRVMLYDSVDSASSFGSPDTHEEGSQSKLQDLPAGPGSIQVMLQNPNTGRGSFSGKSNNIFFSHHQKSVIVDGQVAFVGGIDLAYGRWDTHAFDVVIDRKLHVINDGYNMQLACAREMTAEEQKLTEAVKGRPGFAKPFGAAYGGKLLNEAFQPRQPWEDVSVRIAGPAAFDVFVNFVLRWNSFAGSGTNFFDSSMGAQWFDRAKGPNYLIDPLARGAGGVSVQIARSASSAQLKDELVLRDNHHKYVNDDWKTANPKRRSVVQAARKAWSDSHQTSIRDAMVNCIRSAQAFIYIENQFFMSACGSDQLGSTCPSSNPIIAELANAIGKAIYAGRPFHVYLVLPEHPEGALEDGGTKAQAWWALQGVARASNSLIHRINATLAVKHKTEWGLKALPRSNSDIRLLLAEHGMLNKWREYLTVLNLRNYGRTTSHVLTEMIYVHSKLTIVDDAVAIIGSANINDRSLNGNGDTEIAAVMVDDASTMTDLGQGIKCLTRGFAADLRKQLWKKHLGMLVSDPTTGVPKQGAPAGIDIDKPLDTGTIRGIQKLAAANRQAYNAVFLHTPRDQFKTLTEGRQYFKIHYKDRNGKLVEHHSFAVPPVLQPTYMKTNNLHDVDKAIGALRATVKGFWVEMPLSWGSEESESPPPPASPQMIAELSRPATEPALPLQS